jgi:hypothetical protein
MKDLAGFETPLAATKGLLSSSIGFIAPSLLLHHFFISIDNGIAP